VNQKVKNHTQHGLVKHVIASKIQRIKQIVPVVRMELMDPIVTSVPVEPVFHNAPFTENVQMESLEMGPVIVMSISPTKDWVDGEEIHARIAILVISMVIDVKLVRIS
tara:strand:- start:214 stop:537 length:324 start_codon:yes stop_codon:yes gene_type:complete